MTTWDLVKKCKKEKRDYPPGEVPKVNMKEMPVGNECLGFPSLPRVCLSDMSAFPYLERCLGSFPYLPWSLPGYRCATNSGSIPGSIAEMLRLAISEVIASSGVVGFR